eukprot:8549816-Ditylum_brightwellii.AAC.1
MVSFGIAFHIGIYLHGLGVATFRKSNGEGSNVVCSCNDIVTLEAAITFCDGVRDIFKGGPSYKGSDLTNSTC